MQDFLKWQVKLQAVICECGWFQPPFIDCELLWLVSLQEYCYIIPLDLERTFSSLDMFLLSYSIYGKWYTFTLSGLFC